MPKKTLGVKIIVEWRARDYTHVKEVDEIARFLDTNDVLISYLSLKRIESFAGQIGFGLFANSQYKLCERYAVSHADGSSAGGKSKRVLR